MPVTLKIEMPDGAFFGAAGVARGFFKEMRLGAAVKGYELGRISRGKAVEIAGLSRAEFIDALGRYKVSPFQISPDELPKEMRP